MAPWFLTTIPAILGQCVDCNAKWKFHCETNLTGYFCAPGAYVYQRELPDDVLRTSTRTYETTYSQCTPYPFVITYIKTFCCLYSPSVGCQLALNRRVFDNEKLPVRLCKDCKEHYPCLNKGALPFKSWRKVPLLGIFAMLTQSIFN
ncbi:uncharacterized protein LOC108094274 isoform X2 [Drosophila ficusphila]|uniref:uncharacterized protein LOC108094274 isoform X2 n=1 Tax=Drosophila ficusphila TaxID=30025 RepID=UPI0007E79A40|nr:uncharacterized protein LOC108094274 isoform X2 [Drosophila ficusphila]